MTPTFALRTSFVCFALAMLLTACRVQLDETRLREDFTARHRNCDLLHSERRQPDDATIEVEHTFRCDASAGERRVVAHYTYHDGTWALWRETNPQR